MKRQFAILLVGCTACGTAFGAAFDWWLYESMYGSICQADNTRCYAQNTPGIDFTSDDSWDTSGNCRGKKYICTDALTGGGTEPVAMERADILRGVGISSDFDTDVYVSAENCYGARKTSQNGAMVLMNGQYAKVWCDGILSNPTNDELANGEISAGTEPSCAELAADNYVATLNGNCYGKRYDPSKYAIDCDGNTPVIIVLNGAQYTQGIDNYITPFVVNARFSAMQTSASTQRSIHFPK